MRGDLIRPRQAEQHRELWHRRVKALLQQVRTSENNTD